MSRPIVLCLSVDEAETLRTLLDLEAGSLEENDLPGLTEQMRGFAFDGLHFVDLADVAADARYHARVGRLRLTLAAAIDDAWQEDRAHEERSAAKGGGR